MEPRSGRRSDRRTALTVPCHVSERWLQFADRAQFEVLDEDLIQLDVMTLDDDGEPYKLCELLVSRGDMLRAIAAYGDPPFRTTPVRRDPPRPEPKPARPPRQRRPDALADEQTKLPE